jgi:hypothetical protein
MNLINEALEFEKAGLKHMSTSDRVVASREAKIAGHKPYGHNETFDCKEKEN